MMRGVLKQHALLTAGLPPDRFLAYLAAVRQLGTAMVLDSLVPPPPHLGGEERDLPLPFKVLPNPLFLLSLPAPQLPGCCRPGGELLRPPVFLRPLANDVLLVPIPLFPLLVLYLQTSTRRGVANAVHVRFYNLLTPSNLDLSAII
jgi:hypothetical protein